MRTTLLAPTLEAACQRWEERPALTHRGETLTYGELWERVQALAAGYRRLGVQPGDRVVCQLPDNPEHIIAAHAAWAAGAVHVGADHDLTAPELTWLVERTEATALVFQPRSGTPDPLGPDPLGTARAVRAASPNTVIIVNGPAEDQAEDREHHSLASLLSAAGDPSRAPAPPFGSEETALLFLTSGTTGKPKGVIESYPALSGKLQFFADAYTPGPDDVHLMYLPISHAFGFKLSLTALLSGGRLVLLDRFSPEEALRLVTEEQVTVLPGTPTHFTLLLAHLDPFRHRVDSLRWAVGAAAPLAPSLVEQIYERLGAEIFFVYGCSEGFLTISTDREEIFRGTVGRTVYRGPEGPAPTGGVAVVSPGGGPHLPSGEVGEIVYGTSRPVRYWRELDAAADGWYHTGDLGRIDPDGCVSVLGRLKELINRGGLKVAPAEVEVVLRHHPGVADGAVIATPDAVLGEAVCACIVPADGAAPNLAELRAFLGESLARHKLPDELCPLEAIPRTKISKVDRAALRAVVVDGDLPRERLRG
jgi:acyl-CoA synthetase (AMP-forming)/AMP-acid ligase II